MRRAGGAWLEMLEVVGGRAWKQAGGKMWEEMLLGGRSLMQVGGGRAAALRRTMGSGLLLLLPFLSRRGAGEEEKTGGWRLSRDKGESR